MATLIVMFTKFFYYFSNSFCCVSLVGSSISVLLSFFRFPIASVFSSKFRSLMRAARRFEVDAWKLCHRASVYVFAPIFQKRVLAHAIEDDLSTWERVAVPLNSEFPLPLRAKLPIDIERAI